MNTFETLIFVPEGTLLNEKLAEQTALRQTVKKFSGNFGPAQRIKYTDLAEHSKLMGQKKRIEVLLQNFLPNEIKEARPYFNQQITKQARLIKDSQEFLEEVKGHLNLFLYGKENKSALMPRLKKAGIAAYFESLYFADDFKEKLPDKAVFRNIIEKTGVDPDTALVIGSNLSDEIQGAENADIKSMWLAPKKEKIPITPHPTLHLAKLSDLLFYLNIE